LFGQFFSIDPIAALTVILPADEIKAIRLECAPLLPLATGRQQGANCAQSAVPLLK
jgi:hypothetical protein